MTAKDQTPLSAAPGNLSRKPFTTPTITLKESNSASFESTLITFKDLRHKDNEKLLETVMAVFRKIAATEDPALSASSKGRAADGARGGTFYKAMKADNTCNGSNWTLSSSDGNALQTVLRAALEGLRKATGLPVDLIPDTRHSNGTSSGTKLKAVQGWDIQILSFNPACKDLAAALPKITNKLSMYQAKVTLLCEGNRRAYVRLYSELTGNIKVDMKAAANILNVYCGLCSTNDISDTKGNILVLEYTTVTQQAVEETAAAARQARNKIFGGSKAGRK